MDIPFTLYNLTVILNLFQDRAEKKKCRNEFGMTPK